MKRIGIVALALMLAASACTSGPPKRGARVLEMDGTVEAKLDGGWSGVSGDQVIEPDTRMRLGEDSKLRMETTAGTLFVLPIRGSGAEFVLRDGSIELDRGDLLVETIEDGAFAAMVRGVEVRIAGTVRVTRSLSVRVAAYRGGALAVVAGATLEIPAYRQVILGPNALPTKTEPLRLDPDDAFDGLVAAELINLDRELAALRAGYEAQFGVLIPRLARLEPIRQDAGEASLSFVTPVLSTWRAGDVIVGLVIALTLNARGDGSLATMFDEVRSQFFEGGSWAVIAAGFGLESGTVLERAARAVALITGGVKPGRGEPINKPPPSPSVNPTPRPSVSPSRSSSPRPTPTRTKTPSPTPSPSVTPSPSSSPSTTPTPTVPPPPTGSCQPVDQLLGNC